MVADDANPAAPRQARHRRLEELNRRPLQPENLPPAAPPEPSAPESAAPADAAAPPLAADELERIRRRLTASPPPPVAAPTAAPGWKRLDLNTVAATAEALHDGKPLPPLPTGPVAPPRAPRPTPIVPTPPAPLPPVMPSRQDLLRTPAAAPPPVVPPLGKRIEELVTGQEVRGPTGDAYFLVTTPAAQAPGNWPELLAGHTLTVSRPDSFFRLRLAGLPALQPEDVLYLDIETTGLSAGTPLFLIGTLCGSGNDLVASQFFARDYNEEAAVVGRFLAEVVGKKLLVSFNGKSFDLPYIRCRAALHRLPTHWPHHHFDLLPVARRAWGADLPNCRLQTLEQLICGRTRVDDLPGSEIPQAYHDYVRTGNATLMARVLEHNLNDLLTMADLVCRLPAPRPCDLPRRKPGASG